MVHQVTTSTSSLTRQAVHVRHAQPSMISALLFGALGVGCASPPEPQRIDATPFEGTVTVLNLSHEMHPLTIDPLSTQIVLDCDRVKANPGAMLQDSYFQDPSAQSFTIPLFSGEELAVDPSEWSSNWNARFNTAGCQAFRITSPALPDIVVFYDEQWDRKLYYHNIDLAPTLTPDDQTIVIEADYSRVTDDSSLHGWREHTCPVLEDQGVWSPREFEWDMCTSLTPAEHLEAARVPPGARYSWRTVNNNVPLHFERSRAEQGTAIRTPARCRVPDAGDGLFWEAFRPTMPDFELRGIDVGRDGCHTLELYSETYAREAEGEGTLDWLVCAPYEILSQLLDAPEARLQIEVDREEFMRIGLTQHPTIAEMIFTRGQRFASFYDIDWKYDVRQGCEPIRTTCDEVALPIDLRLDSSRNELLVPGESVDVGYGTLHLIRAAYTPVINLECDERMIDFFDQRDFDPFVEAVLVVGP